MPRQRSQASVREEALRQIQIQIQRMKDKGMTPEELEKMDELEQMYMVANKLCGLKDEIMKNFNLKNVEKLRKAMEDVVEEEEKRLGIRIGHGRSSTGSVAEGLIFIFLLRPLSKPSMVEEELLRCVSLCLRRYDVIIYSTFRDLHTMLIESLTESPYLPSVKPVSEEVKMAVLVGLSHMCRGASAEVRGQVFHEEYRGKLGHTIYLCLTFVKNETSKSLRLQAIHTVQDLGWKNPDVPLSRQEEAALASTFVNFLPGIVQAMTKVATGSDTQGSKIIAAAVDTWSYYVTLVMKDSHLSTCVPHLGESATLVNLRQSLEKGGTKKCMLNEEEEGEENEAKGMEIGDDGQPTLPNVKVTRKWAKETGRKIRMLAEALTPLATHQHWRVRHAMAGLALALATKCVRSLSFSLGPALEILLTLRQDDMEDVAKVTVEALGKLQETLAGRGAAGRERKKFLEELVKKKVISLATLLPSTVRQEDDAKTLGTIRQLEGCLEVLGRQGLQPLLASSHANRLLQSLALLLTLDTSDSHLLHQRSSVLDPFDAPPLKPHLGRSFTHFRDKRILEVARGACGLLGRHGELVRLVHLCVDLLHLHTTAHLYSEGLLLLSLVLDGVLPGETDTEVEDRQHVVQLVLDEVLSPEVLGSPLPCTLKEENTLASLLTPLPSPSSTVEGARVHVVRVIQALGVVGACARLMGCNFTQFLSIILCPVMEFAGMANMAVSLAATNALNRMAEACGCKDVGEFIRESSPHLWYPLSMRLKRLMEYPAAAVVLQVALRYTGTQMQDFMDELVEEAVTALDKHHVEAANPMLRVLLAYVSAVAAEEAPKKDTTTLDSENAVSVAGDTKLEVESLSDNSAVPTTECDTAEQNNTTGDSQGKHSSQVDSDDEESDQGDSTVDPTSKRQKSGAIEKENEGVKKVMVTEEESVMVMEAGRTEESEEDAEKEEKVKVQDEEGEKVMEVERMKESEDVKKEEEVKQEADNENHGAITKFLQEYHNTKMRLKRGLEEEEEEMRLTEEEERKKWGAGKTTTSENPSSNPPSPPPSPPPEPKEPTPPRNIELVRDVVERCSYLLHMGGREGRLLTLEVAKWGCHALRNWENLLLPCAHKLWRPILLLLSQPDPVVGTRTLALVSELVALTGDFLRRRVLQEALPLVLKFLEGQASVSLGAKECQTPTLKAQRKCLIILATLVPALQLGAMEAGRVVGVVGAYLDPRHPSDLFHGAIEVLRVMARSHPHHVWLALALQQPPTQLIHPSSYVPAVKIGSSRHQDSLPAEAKELFQELS